MTEHLKDASTLSGWRKSSHSGAQQGDCVEVVDGLSAVPVRDSKRKEGAALVIGRTAWAAFISSL